LIVTDPGDVEAVLDREVDLCFRQCDMDNDGFIEPDDARALAEMVVASLGRSVDTAKARAFLAAGAPGYDNGLMAISRTLWELCDTDDDGCVCYVAFQRAFDTAAADSRVAFERLDRDRDGVIPVDEPSRAWHEYCTSSDPTVPRNWLFGDLGLEQDRRWVIA
jgi:hypothetical protein